MMWTSSSSKSTTTTITVLLFFIFTALARASAIIGIDYGTEFIKAALVKPGIPMEIVLTKDSKRKEAAAVAFKPKTTAHHDSISPERLYGVDAVNYAARFPDSVFPNLKPLLGSHILVDDAVKMYTARYPALDLMISKDGRVSFKSVASSNDEKFTVEELIAMQLVSVKKQAELMANQRINDCVMAIPAFFTAEERYALTAAAELAGLKVLTLMSDGLAVALNYAMSRNYTPDSPAEHHVIYDMGSGSTTASVVKINGKTVKDVGKYMKNIVEVSIVGFASDRTLGGDLFNQKMAEYLLSEFAESKAGKKLSQSHGKPVSEILNGKSLAKLWREATRVRQILSANSEAIATIESIFPDVDFRSGKIQRATFEELTAAYIDRLLAPIKEAVENAKLTDGVKSVDSVIITGGASRTPFVQKALKDLVGELKISKNVNSDEAAVMGATFRAAGLSKAFKVKDIRISDVLPYQVDLKYKPEGSDNDVHQTLFNPPAKVGLSKFIPFRRSSDFTFSLSTTGGSRVDEITTTNLTASFNKLKSEFGCQDADISTRFSVRLSEKDSMPEVLSGTVSCEVEKVEKKGKLDNVKGFFGLNKDDKEKVLKADEKDDKKASKDSKKKKDEKKKDEKATESASSSASGTGTKNASAEATPAAPVKVMERIYIGFTTKRTGAPEFTAEAMEASKKMLKQFDTDEKTRIMREEARNDLESFTYRCLEQLSSEHFISVSTDKEREDLEKKLADASDWIYSHEAESSPRSVFQEKLKAIKDIEVPIHKRMTESISRPEKVKALKAILEQVDSLVKLMETSLSLHEKEEAIRKVEEAAAEKASLEASAASLSSAASAAASADPLDELDDSSSSSSSTTTSSTSSRTTKITKPKPTPAPYTKEEIQSLQKQASTISTWLETKEKEQEKLKPHENPVLLIGDINSRASELEKVIARLMNRKAGGAGSAKGGKEPKRPKFLEDMDIEGMNFDKMSNEEMDAFLAKLKKAADDAGYKDGIKLEGVEREENFESDAPKKPVRDEL